MHTLPRRCWIGMALCWMVLLPACAAHGQDSTSLNEQQGRILALENSWNQATQQQDIKALDLLLDDELVEISSDGSILNKSQYIASLTTPKLRFEHIASDSMQVKLYGDSAVVVGVYQESGTKSGKPYLRRERFIDTWINRNGAWKCVASQSTLILR